MCVPSIKLKGDFMKKLFVVLYVFAFFTTYSEIMNRQLVSYEVNDTSFTFVWRTQHSPINPDEIADTYEYTKEVYDITSGLIELTDTLSPTSYTPGSRTDEIIVW